MPIYGNINTRKVSGVYVGDKEIDSAYVGNILVYSNWVYQSYSYTYLYNSLIPETISGKGVKNKAKVSKIYANGVVENQIVQNGDFSLNSGWQAINSVYSFNISNNTMTATKTAIGTNSFCYKSNDNVPLQPNHKYLCVAQCKASSNCRVRFRASVGGTTKTLSANTTTLLTDFITTGSSISGIYCGLQEVEESSFPTLPVGGTIETREYRMFDLTLMFGTGNEPTALTDNRIQAILNRGYIAYNTGTYKGTDISEFSSEPYNLLSLDRTQGTLNGSNYSKGNQQDFEEDKIYLGLANNDYILRTAITNFTINNGTISFTSQGGGYGVAVPVRVISGKTYTLEFECNITGENKFISWYDENGMYITNTTSSLGNDFVAPSNAYWGVIILGRNAHSYTYTNLCFHLTGTRTGYAPHQTFSPLSFKYQGNGALNSHDTFEITSTEYVFTKNVIKDVPLTSLGSWEYSSTNQNFYRSMPSDMKHIIDVDMMCDNYLRIDNSTWSSSLSSLDKVIATNTGGTNLQFKDTSLNGVWSNTTAKISYQLATPQVIRIPKKHLGIVKIRDLSWSYDSSFPCFLTTSLASIISKPDSTRVLGNIYVSPFLDIEWADLRGKDMRIALNTNGNIRITDNSISTTTDFVNKYGDYYIFYETENEVSDIPDTIGIEKGGTITSNSQVLPNVDFGIRTSK